jgi:hypothetical protein
VKTSDEQKTRFEEKERDAGAYHWYDTSYKEVTQWLGSILDRRARTVSWNHASQPDQPRKGQRVIIYPKDLPQLEEFLSSADPNVDPEDGHPIALETILHEAAKFECTPLFMNECSERVTTDPFLSETVPGDWVVAQRLKCLSPEPRGPGSILHTCNISSAAN